MTPQEKAKELVHRYDTMQSVIEGFSLEDAKQCALICVDEMLDIRNGLYVNEGSLVQEYLLEVKKEIEAL
jgi:hypothetical protein